MCPSLSGCYQRRNIFRLLYLWNLIAQLLYLRLRLSLLCYIYCNCKCPYRMKNRPPSVSHLGKMISSSKPSQLGSLWFLFSWGWHLQIIGVKYLWRLLTLFDQENIRSIWHWRACELLWWGWTVLQTDPTCRPLLRVDIVSVSLILYYNLILLSPYITFISYYNCIKVSL